MVGPSTSFRRRAVKPNLVLLTGSFGSELDRLKAPFAALAEISVVSTRQQLDQIDYNGETALLSFGTGVLVPDDVSHALPTICTLPRPTSQDETLITMPSTAALETLAPRCMS